MQAWYLYDGSGNRVEQYLSGGSRNHTYYLPGGVEEVTPSGSLIKYYSAGGMTLGLNTTRDSSGISYLASDGLGSVSEALSPSGTATGAVLYSPYGGVRYASGSMPTSKGFTGQYSDTASSGLDYYGARYYDPGLGQFTSADTTNDGLNRYGYVKGNPETFTDPTGHRMNCDDGYCDKPPSPKQKTPPPPTCTSDATCNCYQTCGNGIKRTPATKNAELTDPLTIYSTCSQGTHPGWCSRYFDYDHGAAMPKTGDLIGSADYYWVQWAWNNVELTMYFIRDTGEILLGGGMSLGAAEGFFLYGSVLAAGFGILDAKGTPSATQVHNFITGVTIGGTVGAGVVDSLIYSPSTGGWAQQYGAATGAILYAIGWEYAVPQDPRQTTPVIPPLGPGII